MWRNKHKHPALKLPTTWDLSDLMPELETEIRAVHQAVRQSASPEDDPAIHDAFSALREQFDARCDDFLHVAAEQGERLAGLQDNPTTEDLLQIYDEYNILQHEFARVQIFVSLMESEYYALPDSRAFNEHAVDKVQFAMRQFSEVWDNIALEPEQITSLIGADHPHLSYFTTLLSPAPEREAFVPPSEQREADEAKDVRLADYKHLYAQMMTEHKDAPVTKRAAIATKMFNAPAYQQGKLADRAKTYANPAITTNPQRMDAYLESLSNLRQETTASMAGIQEASKDDAPPMYSWEEATDIVLTAFSKFHPEMEEIARTALIDGWIHAEPTPEKFHNGFNQGTLKASMHPANHPYILMNFDGSQRSLTTLAHELGHAIARYLEGEEHYKNNRDPALNETFAHFAATLAIDEAIERAPTPKTRSSRIQHAAVASHHVATNDAQVQFEHGVYKTAEARDYAPMTTADIADIARNAKGEKQAEDLSGDARAEADAKAVMNFARIMHFTNQPSYYVLSYPLAELGGVKLAESWRNADAETRADIADRWIKVMQWNDRGQPHDFISALEEVGISAEPDTITQGVAARLERLHGALEKAPDAPRHEPKHAHRPKHRAEKPSFVERLRAQRQEKQQETQATR